MNPKVVPYIGRFPVDEYVKRLLSVKGGYWLGTYGSHATETLWSQKSNQSGLESWYINHANAKAKWMGQRVQDCIGIDKYIRWSDSDGNVSRHADTDLNEGMLYDLAIELNLRRGAISTIPKILGLCVGYDGHIGFVQEIKDGKIYVKESRGGDWGVVVYELGKRPGTTQQFEYWFENPFVNYGGVSMLKKGDVGSMVRAWQMLLMFWNPLALPKYKADSSFGGETDTWTNKFQAEYKLQQTGIVEDKTWDAMFSFINKVKADLSASMALVTARDKTISGMMKSNADLEKQLMIADGDIAELQSALNKAEAECADKDQKNAQLTIIIEDNMDTLKQKDDEIARLAISAELLTKEVENHKAVGLALSREITAVTEQLHAVETELKAIKEAPPVVEEPVEYSTKELLHMLIDSIFKK